MPTPAVRTDIQVDSPSKSKSRLLAIDALRGAVMIVMALDHTRDFIHSGAMSFSPEDLSRTTPILFFTRWITHFCLPVFMFVAGMGIFLWRQRGRTRRELSRFLWTRGLWFIALEMIVMRLAYNFSFSLHYPLLLSVLWIFGSCMIAMAALVYLPMRLLAVSSVAVIALHNCLDGIKAAQFGPGAWAWNILHQPGGFPFPGGLAVVMYPLIPWVAVMAAGFCFGQVFLLEAAARQRILFRLGWALTIAFVVIRTVNLYGDPSPWAVQKTGVFTLLSFLRCTKYPPSLDFVLMTLGPAMLILAWFDRYRFNPANPLIVFGRVPLFYFVAHFFAVHAGAVLLAFLRYGGAALSFAFDPLPSMGGPRQLFPPNFGYDLWVVYLVWALIVAALYPLCRWYGRVKAARNDWWLSYL